MDAPSMLPILPAEEGARRLALAHLDAATAARVRVAASSDAEALHDYRVALRRLRSCLRAYRKELRSTVTPKSFRQLRRLARGTNESRDLEVHLAWLAERLEAAADPDRPGISWLIQRFDQARCRASEEMLALDQRRFPKLHDRLRRQLSSYPTTVRLDRDYAPQSTAAVTASRARLAAERLRNRLGRVRDASSDVEIHRARIAAKHLRYLLEPFISNLPGGPTVIERLKALQDGFGDVHDAHVFVAELREALHEAAIAGLAEVVPGLQTLMLSLRARGRQAFEGVAPEWLQPGAGDFFEQVTALSDAIAGLSRHGREVERKFLLTALPSLDAAEQSVEIEQGYLPGERLIERLRRIRSADGVELVRTVKEGSGLVRLELEESVTPEEFDRLWPLTEGRRLRKRRHRIPDGGLTWEIDQFLDRDLVLAEVELPAPGTPVTMPGWLEPQVDREVTDDPAYSNFHLAMEGSPSVG